jgi:hypothetical protein
LFSYYQDVLVESFDYARNVISAHLGSDDYGQMSWLVL